MPDVLMHSVVLSENTDGAMKIAKCLHSVKSLGSISFYHFTEKLMQVIGVKDVKIIFVECQPKFISKIMHIKNIRPDLAIIVYCNEFDNLDYISAFEAGADDVLSYSEISTKIIERSIVKSVSRSSVYFAKFQEKEQERKEFLSGMAAGIAHEINNPLSVVVAASEHLKSLCEDNGEFGQATGEWLDRINQMSWRMAGIIKNLKKYAGVGTQDWESNIPLDRILGKASVTALEHAPKNTIVKFPTQGFDGAAVRGGENALLDVFSIITQNAFDAVEQNKEGSIEISASINEEMVDISFLDNGGGVDPKVTNSIFDPFFTTKPVGSGVGLGLSVARAIAEAHGGRLDLDQCGDQTRFVLSLPIIFDKPAGLSTVLIVEDDTECLQALSLLFEGEYRVLTAQDGQDALNLLEKEQVDIIVSDIKMPDHDGLSLMQSVKTKPNSPPVILISGSDEISELEAKSQGAFALVPKPFGNSIVMVVEGALVQNLVKYS